MMLAISSQDVFILTGMLAAVVLGLFGVARAKLVFVKLGLPLGVVAICLGLAYFGWKPLFGGSHAPGTYFGTAMLFIGLIGSAALGAVEESHRRITSAADPGRGFPVIPSPREPSA